MEFHNARLLPKGLPEIMAQFVPYEAYPETKVIVHSRKKRRGLLGEKNYDAMTSNYRIDLYPTMIAAHTNHSRGTFSCALWLEILTIALHEVGHMVTEHLVRDVPGAEYDACGRKYHRIESLAIDFAERAKARILESDPRMGQPPGALTGYPGIKAYEFRGNFGQPWRGEHNHHRIAEWRAMQCDAQVPIGDIMHRVNSRRYDRPCEVDGGLDNFIGLDGALVGTHEQWEEASDKAEKMELAKLRAIRHQIHRVAGELGIDRHYVNRKGWRYLMFNLGEAEAVYQECMKRDICVKEAAGPVYEWQRGDGFWELVKTDSRPRIPKAQLRLS